MLAPGGTAVITAPLRGTWAEFLDLFRDVLRESGKRERLAALDRYVASLPDARRGSRAGWSRPGLADVGVEVERWEILFKSSREFLFAPLVELGPLSHWKRLAGGGRRHAGRVLLHQGGDRHLLQGPPVRDHAWSARSPGAASGASAAPQRSRARREQLRPRATIAACPVSRHTGDAASFAAQLLAAGLRKHDRCGHPRAKTSTSSSSADRSSP